MRVDVENIRFIGDTRVYSSGRSRVNYHGGWRARGGCCPGKAATGPVRCCLPAHPDHQGPARALIGGPRALEGRLGPLVGGPRALEGRLGPLVGGLRALEGRLGPLVGGSRALEG